MKISVLIILSCSWVVAATCRAALSLSGVGVAATIDFDSTVVDVNNGSFMGAGFQPVPSAGQLDSDSWAITGWSDGSLAFGGTQVSANTDYTRGGSAGGVTTGGIYGFDVDSSSGVNRAFGVQPGGSDWAPGTLTLKLQNNTGQILTALDLAYAVYIRNDQPRANSFNFSYSTDGTIFTSVPSLDLTSAAAADTSPSFVINNKATTISGLSLADNDFFYLRWSGADVSGSGSRDEFALDDIVVTGVTVPEPSTWVAGALLALPFGVHGVRYLRNRKRA